MINIAVIGYGHWGPNHLRVFSRITGVKVAACADRDAERLKAGQERFPGIPVTRDYREVLRRPEIHAVCVSTPTSTHYEIVREALQSGKDVLCEKPLALKVEEAEELMNLARSRDRILMVGHVFLFNPGIRKLKEYIQKGELGAIQYAYSVRTNLGPFRYDTGAAADLASHDIYIFNYLFGGLPAEVSARGHFSLSRRREDLAFINLGYPGNIFVNIHVSWLDPKKVRQITVVGDRKMACWDDLDARGPIRLFDKRVERGSMYYGSFGEFQLISREGDLTVPPVAGGEPLRLQNQYFVECLQKRTPPALADAKNGLEVVKIISAVRDSIDRKGEAVPLRWRG